MGIGLGGAKLWHVSCRSGCGAMTGAVFTVENDHFLEVSVSICFSDGSTRRESARRQLVPRACDKGEVICSWRRKDEDGMREHSWLAPSLCR